MAVQPVEREDVRKSCRTIETLLAVLKDYSETASAFAAIQKRLSKALKDAAALKTNAQFAANAFGASSIILEVLADVDGKFAKVAEKESNCLSSEVKKSFKKLAKTEKAHDERMDESNARVKQAGQVYEKKYKKGAKDAGEEHARYVDLLSVIGPEMSQEKYNHAVRVAQQNAVVTFNVAASLSRIADAEWTRACECMRRMSPTIGPLGEWRSLCEGAWTGSLPDDLPEPSVAPAVSERGQTGPSTPVRRSLPVPPATNHSPGSVPGPAPATASLDASRSPFSAATQNQGSINSITTLSAFPFPPTHFPLPPVMNEGESQRKPTNPRNLQRARSRSSSPNPTRSSATIVTDRAKQNALSESPVSDVSKSSQVSQTLSTSHQPPVDESSPPSVLPAENRELASRGDPRRPFLIARVPPPSDKSIRPISPFKRAEPSLADDEFGVHANSGRVPIKSRSVDVAKKSLGRTDSTHSTGGHVAALRNRYTQTAETPSQVAKDIPRLPMSVSEIASRYQPVDELLFPRRVASPVVDRFPPDASPRDLPIDENQVRRRKQRIEALAELELKEKERQLCQPFRTPEPGNATDGPKGPRESHRPFQHKRGSRSVTHLDGPLSTSARARADMPPKDHHAPFCGCDACSASKYRTTDGSPSSRDLCPPVPPILLRPEKPKGWWIRRLSMPSVNVTFSLDAKKSAKTVDVERDRIVTEIGR